MPPGTTGIRITGEMRGHLIEIAERFDAKRPAPIAGRILTRKTLSKKSTAGQVLQLVEDEVKALRATQTAFSRTGLKAVRMHPVQSAENEISRLNALKQRLRAYFALQRRVLNVVESRTQH